MPRLRQMWRATTCETLSESSTRESVLLFIAVSGAAVSPCTVHRMAWAAQGCARPCAAVRSWHPRFLCSPTLLEFLQVLSERPPRVLLTHDATLLEQRHDLL